MKLFFLFLALASSQLTYHIYNLNEMVEVRKGNNIVLATVDGYVCTATLMPRSADCHRAVARPQTPKELQ